MTGTLQSVASLAGLSISSVVQREASGGVAQSPSLPAAKAGTLTTRTGDGAGAITLGAGHGLHQNDVVDVYWGTALASFGVRYGVKIDAVNGNDVSFDDTPAAGGDVLPAQGTAVTVSKQVTIDTDFDGDLLEMIAAACDRRAHLDFQDAGGASLKAVTLLAGEIWSWFSGSGVTNPLSGNPVGSIKASNADSAAAATLKIGLLYDST